MIYCNTYKTMFPMISESWRPESRLPTERPTDSEMSVTFFLSFLGVDAMVRSSCSL